MFQLDFQGTAIYLLIFCFFLPLFSPFDIHCLSPCEQGPLNKPSRACMGSQRLKWQHWARSGLHYFLFAYIVGTPNCESGRAPLTHLMTKLSALLAITQLASNSSIKGY